MLIFVLCCMWIGPSSSWTHFPALQQSHKGSIPPLESASHKNRRIDLEVNEVEVEEVERLGHKGPNLISKICILLFWDKALDFYRLLFLLNFRIGTMSLRPPKKRGLNTGLGGQKPDLDQTLSLTLSYLFCWLSLVLRFKIYQIPTRCHFVLMTKSNQVDNFK